MKIFRLILRILLYAGLALGIGYILYTFTAI